MKLSSLTLSEVRQYARIEDSVSDADVQLLLDSAVSYILGHTGLTPDVLDDHEDLTLAAVVLVSDAYDNRQMTVDRSNANQVVSNIIDQHSVNLL